MDSTFCINIRVGKGVFFQNPLRALKPKYRKGKSLQIADKSYFVQAIVEKSDCT